MTWLRVAIRTACSHCGASMGDKEPLEDMATSHGICQACLPFVNYDYFGDPLPEGVTVEQFLAWKAAHPKKAKGAAVDWDAVRSMAEQVRAEVTDDVSMSSTGACMDAAETLWESFTGLGYDAQIVDGLFKVDKGYEDIDWDDGFCDKGYLGHFWVELGGKVVDPTADQFNQFLDRPMPDVFVGPNDGRYVGPADTPDFSKAAAKVDWDTVRSIAEQVRGGAMDSQFTEEQYGSSRFEGGKAYPPKFYEGKAFPDQPDKQTGGCDQMAELLTDKLYEVGIKARTVYGVFLIPRPPDPDRQPWEGDTFQCEHVWTEVGGRVVDLTADQFNSQLAGSGLGPMPKVYISEGPDPRYVEE